MNDYDMPSNTCLSPLESCRETKPYCILPVDLDSFFMMFRLHLNNLSPELSLALGTLLYSRVFTSLCVRQLSRIRTGNAAITANQNARVTNDIADSNIASKVTTCTKTQL